MAVKDDAPRRASAADSFPTKTLPRPEVRDLPDAPLALPQADRAGHHRRRASGCPPGEFVLFPYIASQVGLVFVWAALVGLVTQYFINLEIERYTLATGETALTGFSRYWRHWGLVFAILAYFANLWPGWATSSATLASYVFGGTPRFIAIGMLIVIGLVLTLAPVVYVALERAQMVKVGGGVLLFVVGAIVAVGASAWADVPQIVTRPGIPAEQLGFATLLGALAFAGAGGGQNLVQSNWIRDKGFGDGRVRARGWSARSPASRRPRRRTGYIFEPTEKNLSRWKGWWKFANLEQLFTFVLITFLTIMFTSLLAYSTVFGRDDLANGIGFVRTEGEVLAERVGSWFKFFFWIVGSFSLFAAALGIVDYTSRLAADVIKTSYKRDANESKVYAGLVWGLVAIGIIVLAAGFDQPIVLLVIAAVVGGFMMFIYSGPADPDQPQDPARRRSGSAAFRLGALVWAVLLFGTLSFLTFRDQLGKLFG